MFTFCGVVSQKPALALEYPMLTLCCVSAQPACLRPDSLHWSFNSRSQIHLRNLCCQISSLLLDFLFFVCDNPVKIHQPTGGQV